MAFRTIDELEAALRLLAEANELFPDHVGVLFSTACWEALDERPDDAWATLSRAIEIEPRVREWAAGDDDLASVHDRLAAEEQGSD